ncbi:MAG: outer membrane protein assembly factor BamB family protein [Planctomycetota bacterium]|jgi:outer membrane protein assembly factor BamB
MKISKPWPKAMDEWTHYLPNPSGNPVAEDDLVKPPKQLQWVGDPEWARHHEHMASMNALVSSGGRLFFICDEGPKVSMLHPPQWKLTARDAFNGLLLWQRSIDDWLNHLHPLKNGPASMPRRLVVDDDHVYVTLGIDRPVSVLDAMTGKTLRVCRGTEGAQEIILSEGRLFLARGHDSGTFLTAADPGTGTVVWNKQHSVSALTLAANAGMVVFFDGTKIIALDRETGMTLWSSEDLPKQSRANWLTKNPPRLILQEKAVVVALNKAVYALSSDSGNLLWSAPHPRSGYVSPKDLFVIDGLVWYGDTAGAKSSGRFEGRDLLTGEIKRSFMPDIDAVWLSHHRCHFSKATCNYILPARMGVEFVDLKREKWTANHWVRGGCIYGIMPCNGLLYALPHACACYFEAKINGFSALTSKGRQGAPIPQSKRLEKGEAYEHTPTASAGSPSAEEWPTFRQNPARSGSTKTSVAAKLTKRWQVRLGGQLTQPVAAGGRIYISAKEEHTIHALDMSNGKPLWSYTVGSRVDSPPTVYRGLVLFGSRDGWVYCLRAQDGALVWRYRAFPRESLIMVYGRLESAWPVSGSILIENGELHCVAGRNMFLDGGLRYLRLAPMTGQKISETILDQTDPLLGGSIQKYDSWLDMTTTLPDVLSSDGKNIYMRSLPFDMEGNRRRITHIAEETEPAHLFSPTGFLDDSWFHRSYWTYARTFPGGWIGHLNAGRYNPSGRLLVVDDATVFGFGRQPEYYKWTTSLEYRLFAVDKDAHQTQDIYAHDAFKVAQLEKFPKMRIDRQLGLPSGPRPVRVNSYACKWENLDMPLLVTAIVATKNTLFVAGPDDVSDEGVLFYRDAKDGGRGKEADLAKQAALWKGEGGSTLLAVSKQDGKKLFEYHLEALPVFDGMIAADNQLFVATDEGTLVCFGRETY